MSAWILFSLLVLNAAVWFWLAVREAPRTADDPFRLLFVIASLVSMASSFLGALVLLWSGEPEDFDLGITRVEAAVPIIGFPTVLLIALGAALLFRKRP